MRFARWKVRDRPPSGPRFDLSILRIREVREGHYFLHGFTPEEDGSASGGHELVVFGDVGDSYWRAGEEVSKPAYRAMLTIDSSPERSHFAEGVIGGATFHDGYVEIGLSLRPDRVRDIVYELRRDMRRELRVAGPGRGQTGFCVDMFMMAASSSDNADGG